MCAIEIEWTSPLTTRSFDEWDGCRPRFITPGNLEFGNRINGQLKPRGHGLLSVAFFVLTVPDGE